MKRKTQQKRLIKLNFEKYIALSKHYTIIIHISSMYDIYIYTNLSQQKDY